MVTEEDLIRTVAAAYAAGWRQVKLYFMCGLPTETDEDVLQIARMAKEVIRTGREVSGRKDIRCTVSIGGFVPKPHTPFQWAAQLGWQQTDARLALLREEIRSDRELGRAIGFRYHDGRPGIVEGLLARGDRRVGPVIEAVWRDGGRFDGWSEYFDFDRWMSCAEAVGVDVDWYTTREREENEVLPWDHLDSGLDKEWLWQDWQDALDEVEVEDAADRPVSTAGSVTRWVPRSRSVLPTASSCRSCRSPPDGSAYTGPRIHPPGPDSAGPLRQAWADAVRLAPGLPAGVGAGAATSRCSDGLLGRFLAASEGLVRRGRSDGGRE